MSILKYWANYPNKTYSVVKSWKGYSFVRVEEYKENVDYTEIGNGNRVPWRYEKKTADIKAYKKEYDSKRVYIYKPKVLTEEQKELRRRYDRERYKRLKNLLV